MYCAISLYIRTLFYRIHFRTVWCKIRCPQLTFVHPVGFVVAVGKTTVAIYEVGDVISLVTTATRHNERLARTCYAQLHDTLQLLFVVARRAAVRPDRLHGVEPRQCRRLKAGRKSHKNITKQVHYREDCEMSK